MDNINNVTNVSPDKRSNDFTPHPENLTSEHSTSECSTVHPTSDDSTSNRWSSDRLNKVRRRLCFDETVDCYDPSKWLEKFTETEKEVKRNKWNFDFENEIPLDGDWVWERIPTAECPKAQDVVSSMNNKNENRNV
ncbi:unnamed protein product [Psylliodes chrysocephalus]|uniref:Cyclin-dependent kinase inhibitor domain-containing protein n=1 Tax=Psylliodes chrysocephalus TaxID=3402493 RepID=A0A9P0G6Q3_9CUCU|nr:unnamed protein product [Psylliodes chrysocephala]